MSAALAQNNHKIVRSLGLMASASIMSLTMAGEAQAACVVLPNQPLNSITNNQTLVECTGANTGQTIAANADEVEVYVQTGAATLDNTTVTMVGNANLLSLNGSATSATNLTFNSTGNNGQLLIGGTATNLTATLIGNRNDMAILNNGSVTAAPGNITLSAAAGQEQLFDLRSGGTLTSTGNVGGAYLLTGGTGGQAFNIAGTVALQGNGLFINAGDDDDAINIAATALFTNGVVHTINGGAGNDALVLRGSGSTAFATINVERLDVLAGVGGTRTLNDNGSFSVVNLHSGTLAARRAQALGVPNSTVNISSGSVLSLDFTAPATMNNSFAGSGTIIQTTIDPVTYGGSSSGFTGIFHNLSGATAIITTSDAFGGGSIINDGLIRFDAITLGNNISGIGTLTKTGSGTGILSGTSTGFSGSVDILAGTLQIEGTSNVGGATIIVGSAGTLQLNTAGLTVLNNNVFGAGKVIKTGTGTVFVTGNNFYSGGTDIQQGAIRVNDVSVLGTGAITVQAGAALDLAIAGAQTLNQNVTGAGILRKSDVGDLTLLSNGLTGGVDIVGGRVLVSTAGALGGGPVTTAADTQLVFTNSTTEAMSNPISGAGALRMSGTGNLVITSANTYTGGTVIASGRIGLNDGQGLGTGNVIVLGGAVLGIGNVTLANNVSGAGQIVKTASGVGALTGTNTHTGGVDIQGGTLDVTGSGALGTGTVSIASGASLNYTNASAATFSNALSGAGTFNKLGTGQLTFSSNFTLGALNLSAGRTRMNVVGTTNVAVGANATLDGTGRIIGNLTNNGTVAPGNSIGTLTVQGNYTHNANSVLEIEFDGAGNIDLLDVTGNAAINGGTLRFVSVGGAEGQGGTFLRTGGTLTGTFANVVTVGALLPLAVVYEPNRAFMAPSVLTARPSTFNAQSLAAADTALGFIDSMWSGDLQHATNNRIWLNGFSAWGERSASGSTLSYEHDTRGLSFGANFAVGEGLTLGAAIGWAKGDITLGSNGGGGEQSSLLGSINARYAGAGFNLRGGVIYGKVDQDTLRNVSFNGFSGSVDGSTESKLFGGFAELGMDLGSTGAWEFDANLRGSYIRQTQDAYTESGTSPLRLTLGEINTSTLEGQARLTAKAKLWRPETFAEDHYQGLDLRIDLGARYFGTLGDREIPVTFAVSNAGIVLQGDTRNSLGGLLGLALDYTTRSGATFSLGYRGELGQTDRHAVHAGVSFAF